MRRHSKNAIALLITILFVMAITVAIGIGLKQVKEASHHVENENFMIQTSVLLGDVMQILKTSPQLNDINSSEEFFIFLSQTSFIPLESNGIRILIQLSSARSKFNLNALEDTNTTNENRVNALKIYLSKNMINGEYVDVLLDNMGGIKEDLSYNSAIFNEKPYLFRDYIVSLNHFNEINSFYEKNYHDNNLKNVDFEKLFYFSTDKNSNIDLNYATPQTWELILGCDKTRAEQLSLGEGAYISVADLELSDDENLSLSHFNTSFFEKIVDVKIEIEENSQSGKIMFEYDINKKKGSNFVYEI